MEETFEGIYGDRRQEVVFIGTHLDKEELIKKLDECLLTEEEFVKGPVFWKTFEDPFEFTEQLKQSEQEENEEELNMAETLIG
ncbi:MAG: GTP-binding protein, partial [Lentisphaeraceae bacterium]|nr:GTP-binding protein [Lentisphaeraceae bacterium]